MSARTWCNARWRCACRGVHWSHPQMHRCILGVGHTGDHRQHGQEWTATHPQGSDTGEELGPAVDERMR